MKTLQITRSILALLALISLSAAARADLFTFNFAGSGQMASGTLTANATGNTGEFLISSISGTITGVTISSLLAPGSYNGNDNLLETTATGLIPDATGFSLLLSDGTLVNFFTFVGVPFNGLQFQSRSDDPNAIHLMTTFQITPAPVPEPSSVWLLGSGALGLLPTVRRRLSRTA